jgi:hypothetical protein
VQSSGRRQCEGPLNGPNPIGEHCLEGSSTGIRGRASLPWATAAARSATTPGSISTPPLGLEKRQEARDASSDHPVFAGGEPPKINWVATSGMRASQAWLPLAAAGTPRPRAQARNWRRVTGGLYRLPARKETKLASIPQEPAAFRAQVTAHATRVRGRFGRAEPVSGAVEGHPDFGPWQYPAVDYPDLGAHNGLFGGSAGGGMSSNSIDGICWMNAVGSPGAPSSFCRGGVLAGRRSWSAGASGTSRSRAVPA